MLSNDTMIRNVWLYFVCITVKINLQKSPFVLFRCPFHLSASAGSNKNEKQELPARTRPQFGIRQFFVPYFYVLLAIGLFQFSDNKMSPGHILKVPDENGIDQGSCCSADSGYGLGGSLLGDLDPESLRYIRD